MGEVGGQEMAKFSHLTMSLRKQRDVTKTQTEGQALDRKETSASETGEEKLRMGRGTDKMLQELVIFL